MKSSEAYISLSGSQMEERFGTEVLDAINVQVNQAAIHSDAFGSAALVATKEKVWADSGEMNVSVIVTTALNDDYELTYIYRQYILWRGETVPEEVNEKLDAYKLIGKLELGGLQRPEIEFELELWLNALTNEGSLTPTDYYAALYVVVLEKMRHLESIQDLSEFNKDGDKGREIGLAGLVASIGDKVMPEVNRELGAALEKYPNYLLSRLIVVLRQYNDKGKDKYRFAFDLLLYAFVRNAGKSSGEFILTESIARFVATLAKPSPTARVYNPFAGLASFGVFSESVGSYFGQEINPKIASVAQLRLIAHDRHLNSWIESGNSIANWNPSSEKFDLIIGDPPFNVRMDEGIKGKFGLIRTIEHFFIERGVDSLTDSGQLVAVVPRGVMFREGREKELRRYLIDNDLIEAVIEMPGGLLLNTTIPVCVVHVNKKKSAKGIVKMVDAKRYVHRSREKETSFDFGSLLSDIDSGKESKSVKLIDWKDISSADFDLSVSRYFLPKSEEGPKDQVALGEIATLLRGQSIENAKEGKFVRIRDLKSDPVNFEINVGDIETVPLPGSAKAISESCLLVASRWNALKPSHFTFAGEPIYIIPDTLAFSVDTSRVLLEYLILELSADHVVSQVGMLRTGAFVPTIRKDDFLKVRLRLPGLEEQQAIVRKKFREIAESLRLEHLNFEKQHGILAERIEQNSYLRHRLAGPASNLVDSVTNLKAIIDRYVVPVMPEVYSLKISDKHENTLGRYFDYLIRDTQKVASAVERELRAEALIAAKPLMPVDILYFLEEYSQEINGRNSNPFRWSVIIDSESFGSSGGQTKAIINANPDLLREMLDNLLENAVTHGFGTVERSSNRIELFVTKETGDGQRDEVRILFSNTGKSMPKSVTLEEYRRKGGSSGTSGGDGFGGWYIAEVVKRLDGKLDIIDETRKKGLGSDLATSIEICFPLIQQDNEAIQGDMV